MAWHPSAEYYANRIKTVNEAIARMKEIIPTLTEPREIEAHQEQLKSHERALERVTLKYRAWRNKRQNLERGAGR